MGWDTVSAIKLSHLTESQRMAFLIADNRLTENSSWDERMLGEQLKILSELKLDFDLEAIGFEVPEIDRLIDGLNTVPEADPDDLLPAISESAVSVLGDLWQLGKHRVLCGNSLVPPSYERLMDGAKADLVITDPPYNVVIDGHATGLGKIHHREFGMASGEMSSAEFTGFLRKAMLAARDHSIAGSLAYYFMDWRHMTEILSAGQQVYTELLNLCVWAKSNGGMGSFYRSAHVSWCSFSRTERDRTETMFSWASSGGIARTSGITQERIASLAQIPKETSLPCTPPQSQSL
jgi:hypothetical protein